MRITVINGTEKFGVTYRLKEIFLERFKRRAVINEYYLPQDCPAFCSGCANCFTFGEMACKDAEYIQKIERSMLESDLIVITSPTYVMHATGALKAFLDHLGYRWMPHRPAPQMFGKRAVIITQCLGSGAKSAAKDIKHSLSWWGISKIGVFAASTRSDILWDKLPDNKRKKLTVKMRKLADKFVRINYSYPARTTFTAKAKFYVCRYLQNKNRKKFGITSDVKYWQNHGWLADKRPWKKR